MSRTASIPCSTPAFWQRLNAEHRILREIVGLCRLDAEQRFDFIQRHRHTWPVTTMCRTLKVSTSGFYAWRKRRPNRWKLRRAQLRGDIQRIFRQSRGTYGSPRIHAELRTQGIRCAQKTVAKIMRQEGWKAACRRQFQSTTDSRHSFPAAENLLNRQFAPTEPNQIWISDITAIPTTEGWLYLDVTLDLFSRRAVGWSFDCRRTCDFVLSALTRALTNRRPQTGLMHHSDRGSQFACRQFQNFLAQHNIVCSMSRKGNCWDNAVMESFFGTLKQELLQHHRFATRAAAQSAVEEYLTNFYNPHRRHSTLGYLSPVAYEARHAQAQGEDHRMN